MEMLQLPMGCYFSPKSYECIKYLSFKVHGSEDSCCFWEGLIFDCDPYNPKQLPGIFSTVERRDNLYFFTKLCRRGKIGSAHINRTVVGNKGTWHADQTKEVRDADDMSVIGSARTFTFWEKGSTNDRRFLMTEYHLLPSDGDSAALHYVPLKDHILCHHRCAHEGKGKKSKKSINNLKMYDNAPPPPLQSLPPLPPCPAASDITVEEFPYSSTTPATESASAAYSFQTPTDSPTDNALDNTDLIAMDWDELHNAQLDDIDLAMDWVDLDLLVGTTGDDDDVLPPSSSALHVQNDDLLALISVAAAVHPNSSLAPEFPDCYSTSVDNYSSSYRHCVELPTSVLPLATEAAVSFQALLHHPVAPFEYDYDILFDTLPPINFESQLDNLNWDVITKFLDREDVITCYNHPIFHDLS